MTEPFIHPPNVAAIIMTVIFWSGETLITAMLIFTGLRDLMLWCRSSTRQRWLQSLTSKKRRRVIWLSFAGILLGASALVASFLMVIIPVLISFTYDH
jgi:hypothetical protein